MALKVWAAFERLMAGDLNANFAEVAQGRMPIIFCGTGAVANPSVGSAVELVPGAPTAGNDLSGYWNGTQSRIVVPNGLSGLHIVTVAVTSTGGTKGDFGQILAVGLGQGGAQMFARQGASATNVMATWVAHIAAGTGVYVQGACYTTAGSLQVLTMQVTRIATMGPY